MPRLLNDEGEEVTAVTVAPTEPESFETAKPVTVLTRDTTRAAKPVKDLPSSPEAEESILAACMTDQGCLDRATEAGLTAASFHDLNNRAIFGAMAKRGAGGIELIYEDLHGKVGLPRLMEISNRGLGGMVHLTELLTVVKEKETRRSLIAGAARLTEQAYNGVELADLLESAESLLGSTLSGAKAPSKAAQLQSLLSRRVSFTTKPVEPVTRLFLADKPIATGGNIQTITSKAKTGKTVTTGAVTASIVAAATNTLMNWDTFKFRASNPKGHAVIVIDTEQSPFDAWTCYQRSLARVGVEQDPAWLLHFALVGYTVTKRKAALELALEYAQKTFGGVFMVILDGVAHFVASVNDEVECNGLADWLRAFSVQYDCPILCVIHSNEGDMAGDDSRGHIGKQLMRDAESNLLLKKSGEITTITSDKQRKAPITEKDGVAFHWSEEKQMHVSCVAPDKASGAPRKHHLSNYLSVFPGTQVQAKTFSALLKLANHKVPITRNTFWPMVEKGVETGEIQLDRTNVNDPKYWVVRPEETLL